MNPFHSKMLALAGAVTLLAAATQPSLAVAHSGTHGPRGGKEGGGGSVVNDRGRWVLADMFLEPSYPGEVMELSDKTRTEITRTAKLVDQFLPHRNLHEDAEISDFWRDVSEAEYRFVEELPCPPDHLPLPDSSVTQVAYGCTQDGITYLLPEKFRLLDFENRLLAIIHERLHAFSPEMEHVSIGRFVLGAATLRALHRQQMSGRKRRLYQHEFEILTAMQPLIPVVYPDVRESHKTGAIWKNGGGILDKDETSRVTSDVFVGSGSRLDLRQSYARRSELIASRATLIGGSKKGTGLSNANLQNSTVRIYPGGSLTSVTLIDSNVSALFGGRRVANIRVSNSRVFTEGFSSMALTGDRKKVPWSGLRAIENCGDLRENPDSPYEGEVFFYNAAFLRLPKRSPDCRLTWETTPKPIPNTEETDRENRRKEEEAMDEIAERIRKNFREIRLIKKGE